MNERKAVVDTAPLVVTEMSELLVEMASVDRADHLGEH